MEKLIKFLNIFLVTVTLGFIPLILILKSDGVSLPPTEEWGLSLATTLTVSLTTAVIVTFLSFVAGFALFRIPKIKWLEVVILLPSLLPSLFVILALLNVFSPFPYGKMGVIMAQTVQWTGLFTISFSHLFRSQMTDTYERSLILGLNSYRFLFTIAGPLLKKQILFILITLLALGFGNLSIPLILGGANYRPLELLIYQKVLVTNQWSEALGLGIVQIFILMIFSYLSRTASPALPIKRDYSHLPYGWGGVLSIALVISFSMVVIVALLKDIPTGVQQLLDLGALNVSLLQSLLGSMLLVLLTCACTTVFLFGVLCWPSYRLSEKFLELWLAPSSALIGFGLLALGSGTLGRQSSIEVLLKLSFGLFLINIGALYRMNFVEFKKSLESQLVMADIMGLSLRQKAYDIIWPRFLPVVMRSLGLLSFWVLGDFALSSVMTGLDLTLALKIQSLMGSYRLESATALLFILFLVGTLFWYGFMRMARVYSQKLIS